MDRLSPEETLEWIEERRKLFEQRHGKSGLRLTRDLKEMLEDWTVNLAGLDARISIAKQELAELVPGRLGSIDDELRLRSEIAEYEGWHAKAQAEIADIKRRIAEKKEKT
jgi:hypothetical protein